MRGKLLIASARLFIKQGFANTTMKEITQESGVDKNTLIRLFGSKENILATLVKYVLKSHFATAGELVKDKTDDPILLFAVERTLQLYMAESEESMRELYAACYSLPNATEVIQRVVTKKLEKIFKEHLPHLETKDFFELEIASGGIMRGFMLMPCDMYFTMERKVARLLETMFLVYRVQDEKINEAIEFVGQFDFKTIVQESIEQMLEQLNTYEEELE